VARRIGALLAIIVLLCLALLLVWRVYIHKTQGITPEEPSVVSIDPNMARPLL